MTEKTATYHGPGCLTLLGLIFIVLKLTGYITWSWPLVLIPFMVIAFVYIIILFAIAIIVYALSFL